MPLMPGARLGSYEIGALIGQGGMGEVYFARDTKLGRSVAIKVLPDAVAFDSERVTRLEREARSLAALNHPNIGALFGLEESDKRHFLVMELVEGETLAERIARGPLPLEQALAVARQIAEALEAAHEKGIVHRDLKPANVKITPEEKVKVLDFGLAKALDDRSASLSSERPGITHSPTLSMMATQAGVILGTAAYMSPEQAKGVPADQRSDVFSFGVVLYEMLTGRQPFHGETAPEILASVLIREADLATLPPQLNPRLIELLKRCLQKNPKQRWQHIGDVRAEIETIAADPRGALLAAAPGVVQRPSLWRRAIPVVATAVLVGALGVAAGWYFKPVAPQSIARFPILLGEGQNFTGSRQLVAISPDGTHTVYVANRQLYLRSLAELEARPIPGIESATVAGAAFTPVYSPDSRSIAFASGQDRTIKRIAITGGAAVTVSSLEALPFGLTWDPDGIVFDQPKGAFRVSANGGKPELLVPAGSNELIYRPQMLPDGQTLLFTTAPGGGAADTWEKARIVAHSLKSGQRKTLIEGGTAGQYLPTGHIAYALRGVVFAVPFDLRRLEVTGGPVPLVEGVRIDGGTAHFSFSQTGSLVYVPGPVSGSAAQQNDLALLDRKGTAEPLKLPAGQYETPRVSPDGKRVAFGGDDGKEQIVWVYDLSGASSMRRLTFGGKNRFPIWSADGRRVAFQSDRDGDLGIFWLPADGNGTAERLTKPEQGTSHVPESWSPDGKRMLMTVTRGPNVSLWILSLDDKKVAPFAAVQSLQPINATFSRDGRWVAYQSNETGTQQVFAQPFPPTGAKYQISKTSGFYPLWFRDGKELSYVPGPGQLGIVNVTTQSSFTFTNLVLVPRGALVVRGPAFERNYDVARDGRIVGVVPASQTQSGAQTSPQVQVVLNWFEDVTQRVPLR
jgi:Tol biopolymer transport system component